METTFDPYNAQHAADKHWPGSLNERTNWDYIVAEYKNRGAAVDCLLHQIWCIMRDGKITPEYHQELIAAYKQARSRYEPGYTED